MGEKVFEVIYDGGPNDGDVSIGYFEEGQGCRWDQSELTFTVSGRIKASEGLIVGWDIESDAISKINASAGLTLNSFTPSVICTDGNNYQRVLLGFDGTNYGLTVRDQANKTIININDSNKNIAGWTVDEGKLYNTNSYISSASFISFGNTPPTAYGNNAGVWMGWTAGATAKAQLSLYTDANNYFQFDGAKVLIKAANFALDASGNITAASATVSGAITISSGSGYGNLSDKPTALSGINSTEGTKLSGIETGATVGAAWASNLTGRPSELTDGRITTALNASGVLVSRVVPATAAAPSGAGLYLGSDYMGYYSGSAWKSFMKGDGTFQFNGDASNYISWDGSTMTVRGGLTADDITSGIVSARTIQTAGTRLTAATTAGDSTVYVADTSLFPSSGTGYIYDTTVDTFTYTGKSATSLTGCSGVLTHSSGLAVGGLFERVIVSSKNNEIEIFGDRGDTTIARIINLGISNYSGDLTIGLFGSIDSGFSNMALAGYSHDYIGIEGRSIHNVGIRGISQDYRGIYGYSDDGYGGYFSTDGKAPICLDPSSSADAPSHVADKGSAWVTSAGIPYHNVDGSTTWRETVLASLKTHTTWNPISLAAGDRTSLDVTVTGAALGDFVIVCADQDLRLMTMTAFVSAADTVTIRLLNTTGDTHNLDEGEFYIKVIKY